MSRTRFQKGIDVQSYRKAERTLQFRHGQERRHLEDRSSSFFGAAEIASMKHVGKGKRRAFRITFAGISRIGGGSKKHEQRHTRQTQTKNITTRPM
jgi:hypothetical protein